MEMCGACGSPIPEERKRRFPSVKTCSPACIKEYSQLRYREANPLRRVGPTGTVGAISELRVAADLMIKGFEVFRAMSPAAICDLLVLKNGNLLRVEVKTGFRGRLGKLLPAPRPDAAKKHDILALSMPSEIIYVQIVDDLKCDLKELNVVRRRS